MALCTSCGAENVGTARFCVKCGSPLAQAPSPESWRGSADLNQTVMDERSQPSGGFAPQPGGFAPPEAAPPVPVYGWQQQGMQPPPRYGLLSVGERREPVLVAVLTIVTCGLYMLYWWYAVSKETKDSLGRQDINPAMEIVLSVLTCGLYSIYLCYKYPKLMLEMQDRAGMPRNDISTVSILLAAFGLGLVSVIIMQSELNNIWNAAQKR